VNLQTSPRLTLLVKLQLVAKTLQPHLFRCKSLFHCKAGGVVLMFLIVMLRLSDSRIVLSHDLRYFMGELLRIRLAVCVLVVDVTGRCVIVIY
jgi:hypothetical protein